MTLIAAMTQIHVAKGVAHLSCLGLGSCVGVVAFDAEAEVAGIAHLMLPEPLPNKSATPPGKFVSTGLAEILSAMEGLGALRERIALAVCGGAQSLATDFGAAQIGTRNVEAIHRHVGLMGLKIDAEDTGGSQGRTIHFFSDTGDVRIRVSGQQERVLCNLRR